MADVAIRPSASVSMCSQRGESPLQVSVLRLVAEGNCVAVRRGGESITMGGIDERRHTQTYTDIHRRTQTNTDGMD